MMPRRRPGVITSFHMGQAIPSYLIALAVGDLVFQGLSPRVGVYAEPSVLPAAAAEFEDTEAMILATERLYGPYRWKRFDVLVLPPSFPVGGMENPRLTFATPTILAGDKSLVSLVAHELDHSWSGNLVTNATWRDPLAQRRVYDVYRAADHRGGVADGLVKRWRRCWAGKLCETSSTALVMPTRSYMSI